MAISYRVQEQIHEIAEDPALRLYGACLALTHVLSFLIFRKLNVAAWLPFPEPALCWPFWENCAAFRGFSSLQIQIGLWVYCALTCAAALLFLGKKWTKVAWWLLVLLTVAKLGFVFQDFRLRLNQHYMVAFASAAFLFLPRKRDLIRLLVVFFYFWAGILKLDPEWFSGAALYREPWFFHGKLLPWACGYVVLLEIVLVWGIFSRRNGLFWLTFAQLVAFHVFSWKIVGFFYPTVMFALISIFPLVKLLPGESGNPLALLLRGAEPASTCLYLFFFSFLQILPALFPGDSAITGEGRVFALHMFDARVQCEAYAILKKENGETKRFDLKPDLPVRIRCDPLVYFDLAKYLCSLKRRDMGFTDFDLHLNSRKESQSGLQQVVNLQNFCAENPTYDLWRHNRWIL